MKRRDFISLLGGAAMGGVVSPATAQSTDRLRRVAILYGCSAAVDQSLVTAFRNHLEELGWISDRTVHFELRWGEGNAEKIRSHAAELVGWSPDLIFVYTN